jgi:hypothetical protein
MKTALVLLLYVSSNSGQGSGALTSLPFGTLALCQAAGEKASAAFQDVNRTVRFVCVESDPKADAH